jgi:hypothetical protein
MRQTGKKVYVRSGAQKGHETLTANTGPQVGAKSPANPPHKALLGGSGLIY